MKYFSVSILFVVLSLTSVFVVKAQAAETIWIQAGGTSYKTGETATATINAVTARPIQGFTAQIRYDPDCLLPVNAATSISGMNGLAVPQTSGLVDASFASTMPQTANGVLAEVRFTTLKGCQTNLTIETASLVIRNESGFAAPLSGVNVDQKVITLDIDSAVGNPQPLVASAGSVLPLTPTIFPEQEPVNWWVIGLPALLVGVAIATVIYKLSRK